MPAIPPKLIEKVSGSLWDGLSSIAIVLLAASFALRLLSWRNEQVKLRDAIAAVEGDVLAIEARMEQPSPAAAAIASRLKQLEHRVLYPRFSRHVAGCRQCRGDEPSEEGGPSPLCERGFKLMQQDMAELKGEEGE